MTLARGAGRLAVLVSLLVPATASAQARLTDLPRRSAEMELSLGAFDHPVLAFSRISALTVDDDGRLYVVQPIEGQVTVLNPDGSLHHRLGRKGRGPGEFLAPTGIGWRGDTLWVIDSAQRRHSWFHGEEHVRTARFAPVGPEWQGRLTAQLPMSDGSFVSLLSRQFERPTGHPDNYFPIVRTTETGDEELVAVLRESFPFRIVIEHSEGTAYGSPLFSDFPLQSWTSRRAAIVDRPFGEVPEASIRVTTLEASGDTAYSREYSVEAEPLTDAQWDARIREALAGVDRPDRPYGVPEVEAASARPEHWPAATRVVQGLDLTTWVALADLPWRETRDWAVIDPEGVPRFRVTLPRDFNLFTAEGDLLLGVWQDELDVPYVQRYRLEGGG